MDIVTRPVLLCALAATFVCAVDTLAGAQQPAATPSDCSRPMTAPTTNIKIPSGQRSMTFTRDGCFLFIAFVQRPESPVGFGVYERSGDTYREIRFVPITPGNVNQPFGMTFTRDQKILLISHFQQLVFYDVAKLTSGTADAKLGELNGERFGYSNGVVVTPDDKYAFVSQGQFSSMLVIDLEKGRASGFTPPSVVGVIPMAFRPSWPAISPDGQFLYVPNQQPPDVLTRSMTCRGGKVAEGSVSIIDVQKAITSPQTATVGWLSPAGCAPTAVRVSRDGNLLYVVAGGDVLDPTTPIADSSVVVFDIRPVRQGQPATLIGKIPVPRSPTTITETASRLLVGHLPPSKVTVVDMAKLSTGQGAILGELPFSSGLGLTAGGRIGLGLGSEMVVVVDLDRMKPEPIKPAPSRYDAAQDCSSPLGAATREYQTAGLVLQPVLTRNGCWMFHAVVDAQGVPSQTGITLRRRVSDNFDLVGNIALPIPRSLGDAVPLGLTLTKDQKTLIVSHSRQLTFMDVDAFIGGNDPLMGRIESAALATSAGLALTPDDGFLFVAQATGGRVAVLDMVKARTSGFKDGSLLKSIPTAPGPTNLVASHDGKYIYVIGRASPSDGAAAPRPCAGGKEAEGVVQVIDVQRAVTDAPSPVSAPVAAGCAPQHLALSPDGLRLSVAGGALDQTMSTDNAVVVFDVSRGQELRQTGRIPLPALPGRLADNGTRLFVSLLTSLRAPVTGRPPVVIDPTKASSGKAAIVGQLASPSASLTLSDNGQTLYLSVMRAFSVMDVGRLAVTPVQD